LSNKTMQNLAIGLLVVTGLVLYLFQSTKSSTIKIGSYVAIIFLIIMAFVSPMICLMLAAPIFLVVWFDHYNSVLSWWSKVQKTTINTGGSAS
jgi:hypothetical protein